MGTTEDHQQVSLNLERKATPFGAWEPTASTVTSPLGRSATVPAEYSTVEYSAQHCPVRTAA